MTHTQVTKSSRARKSKPDAVAALRRLIEAQDLTEADLDRMLGRSLLGGKILRRECPLSAKHLELIGRHLHVAPELVLSLA